MKIATRTFTQTALCAAVALALLTACSDSQETPQAPAALTPTTTASAPSAASPEATSPEATTPNVATSTPAAASTVTPQAPATPATQPVASQQQTAQVDSSLDQLLSRIESGQISEAEAAAQTPLNRADTAAVTVELSGDPQQLLDLLSNHGITPRHATAHYIEVFVPPLLIRDIAQISDATQISLIVPPQRLQQPPNQSIKGDGSAAHRSIAWNQVGFSGADIKIGVIDTGFTGATSLLGTELPPDPQTRCYTTETDSPTDLSRCDQSEHGTIVAESIIDIAPQATLYLASVRSSGDLADVVDWMIEQDVSIINMSLAWTFDGPGDGSSPRPHSPLNTLARAVSNDILWVNAAGNSGQSSWLGVPTDTDGDGIVEFAGEERLALNINETTLVQLRWDGDWTAATTDLDLHIFDASGNLLASSTNQQQGNAGDRPREIARPKAQGSAYIEITSRTAELPRWMQIVLWSGAIIGDDRIGAGSITSPAESASSGMLAVGATHWANTHNIEDYSSRGPAPDGRTKPDIVGIACGITALTDTFCGTSQAAPHISGLAALVRQRFPDLSAEDVRQYLMNHAEDRGSAGPDNTWGAGFAVLPAPPTPTPTPTSTPVPTAIPSPTPTPEPHRDLEALEAIYRATDPDNWWPNHNWFSDKPLWQWRGVAINDDGRVAYLQLAETTNGTLPPEIGYLTELITLIITQNPNLTGSIPPELGDLTKLTTLRITINPNLTGSIPPELGNLTKLTTLEITDNSNLTGSIPPEIGNLTELTTLRISGNPNLTGSIPPELGNLKELHRLYMTSNRLSGPIPPELGTLNNLEVLHLYSNKLSGPIPPELSNLRLRTLQLYRNNLSGPIPPELGNMQSLMALYLSQNQLSGPIPPELSNMQSLRNLDLAENQLSGSLPSELSSLPNLITLDIDNNHLTGQFPESIMKLKLGSLRFNNNNGLCIPNTEAFRQWYMTIYAHWFPQTGPVCQ